MAMTRRDRPRGRAAQYRHAALAVATGILLFTIMTGGGAMAQETKTYIRFEHQGDVVHGRVENGTVHLLRGDLFDGPRDTGETVPLSKVRPLAPVMPSKALAVGLNYRSHAGDSGAGKPELFIKLPSSIIGPGEPIPVYEESSRLHYEGEMVVVIGKRARNVSAEDAGGYIFGVTAGNDVSERSWQSADVQWWRAKAADGFSPLGPAIVTGLNYDDLMVQTRLNGETVQQESSKMLIHSVADIVSFASRYVTLQPGDVIYTGTPGSTRAMAPGDVVEVEVEGVGVLSNPVRTAQ